MSESEQKYLSSKQRHTEALLTAVGLNVKMDDYLIHKYLPTL